MKFLCEGLPEHGLVLVPPSSPVFDSLLTDIERRLGQHIDGEPPIPERFRLRIDEDDRPTSAILANIGLKTVAAMWAVWQFETETGRRYNHSRGMLSTQPLLIRYGSPRESWLKIAGYWHTILPGSKRYLSESGLIGDNTDVRPPADDEKWQGGIGMGGGRGRASHPEPVKQVTLVLDGIFFLDGEFVGPNREKFFEQTVAEAEAHVIVGRLASEAHIQGLSTAEILSEVESVTGPAPGHLTLHHVHRLPNATPEQFRQAALADIAFHIAMSRRSPGVASADEHAVTRLIGWNKTAFANFRKG